MQNTTEQFLVPVYFLGIPDEVNTEILGFSVIMISDYSATMPDGAFALFEKKENGRIFCRVRNQKGLEVEFSCILLRDTKLEEFMHTIYRFLIQTVTNVDLPEDIFPLDESAGEEYAAEFLWIPIRDDIEKDLEKYKADLERWKPYTGKEIFYMDFTGSDSILKQSTDFLDVFTKKLRPDADIIYQFDEGCCFKEPLKEAQAGIMRMAVK